MYFTHPTLTEDFLEKKAAAGQAKFFKDPFYQKFDSFLKIFLKFNGLQLFQRFKWFLTVSVDPQWEKARRRRKTQKPFFVSFVFVLSVYLLFALLDPHFFLNFDIGLFRRKFHFVILESTQLLYILQQYYLLILLKNKQQIIIFMHMQFCNRFLI